MVADTPSAALDPSPECLAAARHYVQTLSSHEREALLRALAEYDELHGQRADSLDLPPSRRQHASQKAASVAPPTPPPEVCLNAFAVSPPASAAVSAPTFLPAGFVSSASQIETSIWSPKTPSSSPTFVSRLRSTSFSQHFFAPGTQPATRPVLRSNTTSSKSRSRLRRSRSLPASEFPNLATLSAETAPSLPRSAGNSESRFYCEDITTDSTPTLPSVTSPVLSPATASAAVPTPPSLSELYGASRAPEPIATSVEVRLSSSPPSTRAYWCTSCNKKYTNRAEWMSHDEACRSRSRYRRSRPQRSWACGFCAAFLGSQARYYDHVALHFEGGKTPAHWHYANVIYGLLHQPGVYEAWKRLWNSRTAALPSHLRPKASWPPETGARDDPTRPTLQDSLEVFDPARKSPEMLAARADALAIFVTVSVDDSTVPGGSTATATAVTGVGGPIMGAPYSVRKSSRSSSMRPPSTRPPQKSLPHSPFEGPEEPQPRARRSERPRPPLVLANAGHTATKSISSFARPSPCRYIYAPNSGSAGVGLGVMVPTENADVRGSLAPTMSEEATILSPEFSRIVD